MLFEMNVIHHSHHFVIIESIPIQANINRKRMKWSSDLMQ